AETKTSVSETSSRETMTDGNIRRSLTRKALPTRFPEPIREPEHFKNKNGGSRQTGWRRPSI
ncbi:MAG TPA: hypothetical protein VGD13_15380, partial [Xanthobacteraceae bacterium]